MIRHFNETTVLVPLLESPGPFTMDFLTMFIVLRLGFSSLEWVSNPIREYLVTSIRVVSLLHESAYLTWQVSLLTVTG